MKIAVMAIVIVQIDVQVDGQNSARNIPNFFGP
jgi:hypothetical protein